MDPNFCPFANAMCRKDCVLYKDIMVADPCGKASHCWLSIKIKDINEYQHDDLTLILNTMKSKKR